MQASWPWAEWFMGIKFNSPIAKIAVVRRLAIKSLFVELRKKFINQTLSLGSTRFKSTAFVATIMEEADISKAAISGFNDQPRLL